MDLTPGQRDLAAFNDRLERLGEATRTWEINRLQALWTGHAYDGRPSFWDRNVHLQERAPVIVDPVLKIAGERLAAMVFGERRFPKLSPMQGATGVPGLSISPEDATVLSDVINAIVRTARIRVQMRGALLDGLKSRSACIVQQLRAGKLHITMLDAKWCTPTFDPRDDSRCISLDYRFRYDAKDEHGRERTYWSRRVIGETADVQFKPALARDDGKEPAWEIASAVPTEFCAVTWVKNTPDTTCTHDLDGVALGEGMEDEIEALDLELSLIHRNALYNGDPLTYVTNAGPDDLRGEHAQPSTSTSGWRSQRDNGGIKKTPGGVLFIDKEGASMGALEAGAVGAGILHQSADRIRRLIFDALHIVAADPEKLGSGDLSSRSLRMLFAPMLDYVGVLQDCWGDALSRVLSISLRLYASAAAEEQGAFLQGIDLEVARPILRKFAVAFQDGSTRWVDPPLELQWGPDFEPSQTEVQNAVSAANTATNGQQVMSVRTAVTMLQPLTSAGQNVQGELEEIAKERAGGAAEQGALLDKLAGPTAAPSPEASAELPQMFAYDYESGAFTVNEVRQRKGFAPIPGGEVPLPVYLARYATTIATAAAAQQGIAPGAAPKPVVAPNPNPPPDLSIE